MSVWTKILKMIKNPVFADRSFNLLKYSQPPPEISTPPEISVPPTVSPKGQFSPGLAQPIQQPSPEVAPEKSTEEEFRRLKYIDEYIRENVRKPDDLKDPLPNHQIFQELQTASGAENFIERTIGIAREEGLVLDRDYAKKFLNVILELTKQHFQSEEYQKAQGGDIEGYKIPEIQKMKHNLDSLYITNVEGVENYAKKVKRNDKSVQALFFALGDPDPDKLTGSTIDQRFNFFLYNPDKMQDIIVASAEISKEVGKFFFDKIGNLKKERKIIEEQMKAKMERKIIGEQMKAKIEQKKNVQKYQDRIDHVDKEIEYYQTGQVQSIEYLKEGRVESIDPVAKSSNQKITFLANNVGDQLIQRLRELIVNKDEKIIEWVERGVKAAYFKERGFGSLTGVEGENLDISTEEAMRSVQMQDYKYTREDEIRAYGDTSTFAKVYLEDILNEIRALREKTILPLLNERVGQLSYGPIERLSFYSKMVLDKVGKTLDNYEAARRNIYRELHEKQDELMFTLRGKERGEKKKWKKDDPYDEALSYIGVPKFFIEQIKKYFLSEGKLQTEGRGFLSEEEIREHINIYKNNIASGKAREWSPEFFGLIRPLFLDKKYQEIGKLKNRIKQLAKNAATIKNVDLVNYIRSILKAESTEKLNYNEILDYFSDGDPSRFILATIQQSDIDVNYYSKGVHNLKADIGGYVRNLLKQTSEIRDGDVSDASSKAFSQEAITSYVEMFGPVKSIRVLPEFRKLIGKKSRDDEQIEKIKEILGGEDSQLFQEFTNLYEIFKKKREIIEDSLEQIRKKLKHRQELENQRLKTYNTWIGKKVNKFLEKVRKDKEKLLEQEPKNNLIKKQIDELDKSERDVESFKMKLDENIHQRLDDREYAQWGLNEKYRAGRQKAIKSRLDILKDLEGKIARYEGQEEKEISKLEEAKKYVEEFVRKYKLNIDLTNKVAFNLLYSGWQKTLQKISMLMDIKEKYNNIKFASGVSHTDVIIKHAFNQYKTFFFSITRK